jgi:hypothetical protein
VKRKTLHIVPFAMVSEYKSISVEYSQYSDSLIFKYQ